MRRRLLRTAGFTLVEAIVVITITGILAAVVAVFIKAPVDSYFDTARRAALTDAADTAVRRMSRDIRLSLPNSVRNPADGSDNCVEFMPTRIGGRYRAATSPGGAGNPLDFTVADGGFDMLWPNSALSPVTAQIVAGDVVVVYNDGSASGNAYMGTNAIQIASVTEPGLTANTTGISFVTPGAAPFDAKTLPAESLSFRFQVVPSTEHVVAYACTGAAPAMVLTRHSRVLTGAWAQPANCTDMVAAPATSAILAENLRTCSLKYEAPGSSTGPGRFGIVSISLEMEQSGESVRLYHQVHVDNTP